MVYRLKTIQSLISVEEAWDFLSDPRNLKTITQTIWGLKFWRPEDKMFAGQS